MYLATTNRTKNKAQIQLTVTQPNKKRKKQIYFWNTDYKIKKFPTLKQFTTLAFV